MIWRKIWSALRLLLVTIFIILVLAPEWPSFAEPRYQLDTLIQQRDFDFVGWELNALSTKLRGRIAAGQAYLDEGQRREFVLEYLALVDEVRQIEREIELIYVDPAVTDPALASADLQADAASIRAEMTRRQPLAEAILQEQVAAILIEEGFDVVDTVWPPVTMNMTPLPLVLVVSPRDEIQQLHGIPLQPGITVPDREVMETDVHEDLDLSALVVPIGGLGIYPSMILETGSINFLTDVVAHEWAHHWLTLHPLGLGYNASPQMRTINETAASVIGTEVGRKVMERYYPELLPPEIKEPAEPANSEEETEEEEPAGPPPFDFRAAMAETRVVADELLADGKIDDAEAYMEARRRYIVENGYNIRKLNQAYFAFYGAYADTPGATGGDPVGPTILAIRERSSSLRAFMDNIANVTSFAELEQVLDSLSE